MRTSSASKKRPQFDKYIESRVLITSHSINPLSQHISTKLDLIKQQISREFHQKYPTDKKRTTSIKKSNSSSKSKLTERKDLQSLSKKLNFNKNQQPSQVYNRLRDSRSHANTEHLENQTFRQKFYDLQDKYLAERNKNVDDLQKNVNFIQKVLNFLEQPSAKTADELKQYFPIDRQRKIIEKFLLMNQDIEYAQKTLSQLLAIVEVENIQTLITQLKARQTGYKNLGECSYKILQLETAYNKLQKESQDKLNQLQLYAKQRQAALQNQLDQQIKDTQSLILMARKQQEDSAKLILNNLVLQIQKITHSKQSAHKAVMFVTFDKIPTQRQPQAEDLKYTIKRVSSCLFDEQSIQKIAGKILQLFTDLDSSISEIQKQAQQNVQKLIASKQDMDRLEKLIQSVTYETEQQKNKLIQHFQQMLQQNQIEHQKQKQTWKQQLNLKTQSCHNFEVELEQLKNQCGTIAEKVEQLQRRNSDTSEKCRKRQQTINKLIKIVCDTTGQQVSLFGLEHKDGILILLNEQVNANMDDIVLSKVEVILKKHLLVLKQNLQAAENMILWHEKQIEIKESLLREYDFNLKKLIDDSELNHDREKQIIFERDEYKYLLTNLRQNTRQMKIDHQKQLQNLAKQKDDEYLNSNRDILIDNQRINDQISKLELQLTALRQQLRTQSTSHGFFKKKAEQFELTITDLRKKLQASEIQAGKYKQHLGDIEISFKEVQSMSEINSTRLIDLQSKNKIVSDEAKQQKIRNQNLAHQIQLKDENYNKLKFQFEELEKKNDKLTKIREDLQLQNSNLRLKSFYARDEINQLNDKIKKSQFQNANLNKENKKLMEQVNIVTKKLLGFVGEKHLINKNRSELRQQVQKLIQLQIQQLKSQCNKQKILIGDYMQEFQSSFMEQAQQIKKQMIGYFSMRKVNESVQNARKQSLKLRENDEIRNSLKLMKKQSKISATKKQLVVLKQDLHRLQLSCKSITKQFGDQSQQLMQMITVQQDARQSMQSRIDNNYEKLMKTNLNLNSIRNSAETLKEQCSVVKQDIKELIVNLSLKFNQKMALLNSQIQEMNKSRFCSCQKQQLSKVKPEMDMNEQQNLLANSPISKKRQNSPEQHQFMSPQFAPLASSEKLKETNIQKVQKQDKNQSEFVNIKQDDEDVSKEQEIQPREPEEQKAKGIHSERYGNIKAYSFKQKNSAVSDKQDGMHKLRWSGIHADKQQILRVKKILFSLKSNDAKDPNVPYFELIQKQYRAIKQRLIRNNFNLDISAVSFRHNSLSSPSSVSFSKDFLVVEKRFNTEPNEEPAPLLARETIRSQNNKQQTPLQIECAQLRDQIQMLNEQVKMMEDREEQYKIAISQLQKQKTQLQNQTSKQMKQKLFLKFVTELCKQNWKQAQNSCRIILKLVGLSPADVTEKIEALKQLIAKFQKKKSGGGFFSSFSNKNIKN